MTWETVAQIALLMLLGTLCGTTLISEWRKPPKERR